MVRRIKDPWLLCEQIARGPGREVLAVARYRGDLSVPEHRPARQARGSQGKPEEKADPESGQSRKRLSQVGLWPELHRQGASPRGGVPEVGASTRKMGSLNHAVNPQICGLRGKIPNTLEKRE